MQSFSEAWKGGREPSLSKTKPLSRLQGGGGGGPLRNGLTDSLICLILCCCCLEQKLQAYGELDTNPKPCSTHTRAALYTNTLLKGILCKLNRQPGRLTHSSSLSFSSFAGIWGWMQSWSQIETYPNRAWSHLNCVCSL